MALLDILGRRWTLRILWELRASPVKFRDLSERADSMSQSVLSRRLKELEAVHLVISDADGWRLSREGFGLLDLLMPLSEFAGRWAALLSRDDARSGRDRQNRRAVKRQAPQRPPSNRSKR